MGLKYVVVARIDRKLGGDYEHDERSWVNIVGNLRYDLLVTGMRSRSQK
jgi:hypothetical protein